MDTAAAPLAVSCPGLIRASTWLGVALFRTWMDGTSLAMTKGKSGP